MKSFTLGYGIFISLLLGLSFATPLAHAQTATPNAVASDASALTPSTRPSGEPEAPSPWWLVVMPAIPVMGGGIIYIKRNFFTVNSEK